MSGDDSTVYMNSNLGKRLDKIKKDEFSCLLFKGKKMPLVKKITIGRSKDNMIVVEDQMVSRYHAVIQKIKDDYYVMDLHSANGTFINEKKIPMDKWIRLKENDKIRVGKNTMSIG